MKNTVGGFMRRITKYLLIPVFCGIITYAHEQLVPQTAHIPAGTRFTTPQQKSAEKETWIVVFVHGIMSVKPHLSAANFLRFMADDVQKTTYSKTIELMRQDPLFFQYQAMQEFGLKSIDLKDRTPGNASGALANVLSRITEQSYPTKQVDSHYYTFGWSGLLSVKQRYLDAKKLFIALEKEVLAFRARGINPKVKVIGYSHGGNVVLNLGAVSYEFPNSPLTIDEAIFWGMPVQKKTDWCVNNPIFKKIYHFYSAADRVQKLDFFSFRRCLSGQVFKSRGAFALPKKLIQIQIKITRNATHTRKKQNQFEHTFDFTDPAVVSGKSHLLRDSSPGHAELWAFGWSEVHYRPTFALAPLPAIALIPFYMYILESIEQYTNPNDPIIIDVRPEHGLALVKNVKKRKFYSVFNFIQPDRFRELQELALTFKPENFSEELVEKHIQQAFTVAKKHYLDTWSKAPHRVRKRNLAKRRAAQKAMFEECTIK